jgi:hypothetical protein
MSRTSIPFLLLFTVLVSCGRTESRYLGKDHRQVLEPENVAEFISISYDKRGTSTVKDVTFRATDGYVYTQEFQDVSPFGGVIRWVPHSEGGGLIRTRAISRWTGGATDVALPDDCAQVLGVDVGYESEDERVKNLTYRSMDGRILSKEYRDGFIDRQFEGWLEIKVGKGVE